MPSSWRWAGTLVLAVAVGCAALGPRAPSGPPGEPAAPTEGRDADGRLVRLDELRGRAVLLSFWHSA